MLTVGWVGQAQELVESLEWLNTPVPLRLRTIIFTSNAPVSARWKVLLVSLGLLAREGHWYRLGSCTPLWNSLWGKLAAA